MAMCSWHRPIAIHFDRIAHGYDLLTDWTSHAELFQDIVSCVECGPILDVGSGPGTLASQLGAKLPEGTLIASLDCSLNMCLNARIKGLRIIHGVGENLPLGRSSIRTIVCRQALHYLDPERSLSEWCRVLQVGGTVVVSQSVSDDIQSTRWWRSVKAVVQPLRRSWWSNLELERLLSRHGLEVEACKSRWIFNRRPKSQFLINAALGPLEAEKVLEEWVHSSPSSVAFAVEGEIVSFRQFWVTYKAVRP